MIFSFLVRNVENLIKPIYRKDAVVCYKSSFMIYDIIMIYYITADHLEIICKLYFELIPLHVNLFSPLVHHDHQCSALFSCKVCG